MNIWYSQHPGICPTDKPSCRDFFDYIYELTEDEYFDILAAHFTGEELEDREMFNKTLKGIIKHKPETMLEMEIHKILDVHYYRDIYNGLSYV